MHGNTYRPSQAIRTWVFVCSVIALLVAAPVLRTVEAQTPEATTTDVAAQSVEPAAQEVPPPTETPVPTPTEVPPPPPTEIQLPTEVPVEVVPTEVAIPTEVIVPTAEPTQVVEPTVAPAEVVTPEPTVAPTATPSPTPSPTATPTPKTRTSLQIAANGNEKYACALVAGSPTVLGLGEYSTYKCTGPNPLKAGGESIPEGWRWGYSFGADNGPLANGWLYAAFDGQSPSTGNIDTAYIYFGPYDERALPGATATMTAKVFHPNGKDAERFSLSATRRLGAGDLQITCIPGAVSVPTSTPSGIVKCSISGKSGVVTTLASLKQVTIAAPTGWTFVGANSGTSITLSLNNPLPYNFEFQVSPSCQGVSTQGVSISSSVSFNGGASFAGPSASVGATHQATATTVSASISNAPDETMMNWPKSYSFAEQTGTGFLKYTVTAAQNCAGWNVTLQATDFGGPGAPQGQTIPATNFAITGATTPAGGPTVPNTSGTLNTPVKVLSAQSGIIGTYSQTVNLKITIPGGTRVGTYTSTVTVTASSSP